MEMPGLLETRWLTFDDKNNPSEWIDEKGVSHKDRKGGRIDINTIMSETYHTLLPEFYLRPYSPHYIQLEDFKAELGLIEKEMESLLNEIS